MPSAILATRKGGSFHTFREAGLYTGTTDQPFNRRTGVAGETGGEAIVDSDGSPPRARALQDPTTSLLFPPAWAWSLRLPKKNEDGRPCLTFRVL